MSLKEIRTKMQSIRGTKKITKAMEMIAASKMRKTQEHALAIRPYAERVKTVLASVMGASLDYDHPFLMAARPLKRVGVFAISSDRGLCGGLNVNLFRLLLSQVKTWDESGVAVDFCAIGHKAETFFKAYGGHVVAAVAHLGGVPALEKLVGVIQVMLQLYASGGIDALYLAYNRFENTMKQVPVLEPLLPITSVRVKKKQHLIYTYEPHQKMLIDDLIRRYVESLVERAVAENLASEQAARRLAMSNATDNANQLIEELLLSYNKVRQAQITQEISEIIGGASSVV